ncbi:MAG: DUF493 domain-containing protein [Gammaproteobacteria bacterium]
MNDSSLLKFPLEFPVKIVGRDTREFHDAVAAILTQHVAPFASLTVTSQPSREGRFVSLTVTFTAMSREQLDALYQALTDNEHVLMSL